MKMSRFFYAGLILATTSCSSVYDVWQGYEDIEPEIPNPEIYQTPRQGRGELDEVVVQAKIENDFLQKEYNRKEISVLQIEEIYKRAQLQSEADLDSSMEIPEYPSSLVVQEIEGEGQTIVIDDFSEEIGVAEDVVVTEDVIEETSVQELTYEEMTMDVNEIDGVIVIGGDSSVPMMPSETENLTPVAEISQETIEIEDVETFPVIIEETSPVIPEDPYQPLIIGDDYSASTGEISTDIVINDDIFSGDSLAGTSILATTIKYNKGSDKLSTKDIRDLKAVVTEYKRNPAKVKVIGYAINYQEDLGVDKAVELMELATRRAEKVGAQLKKLGIKDTDVKTTSEALDASSGNTVPKKDVTEVYFEF